MYGSLREKIAAESAERKAKYARFRAILDEAHAEAHAKAMTHTPRPMTVRDGQGKIIDVVPEGLCGFAWVIVRPGTSSFAKWAKEHAGFRKSYYGGMELWVSGYEQSAERKDIYAQTFATVLNRYSAETGATAGSGSRLD